MRKLLLLLILCALPGLALTVGTPATSVSCTSSPCTFSYTLAASSNGAPRALYVTGSLESGASPDVTANTYDGVTVNQVVQGVAGVTRAYIGCLDGASLDAIANGSHTVSISYDETLLGFVASAFQVDGGSCTVEGTPGSGEGSGLTSIGGSISTTTTSTGAFILFVLGTNSVRASTMDCDGVEPELVILDSSPAGQNTGGVAYKVGGAPGAHSITCTWTTGASADAVLAAFTETFAAAVTPQPIIGPF